MQTKNVYFFVEKKKRAKADEKRILCISIHVSFHIFVWLTGYAVFCNLEGNRC